MQQGVFGFTRPLFPDPLRLSIDVMEVDNLVRSLKTLDGYGLFRCAWEPRTRSHRLRVKEQKVIGDLRGIFSTESLMGSVK